MFSEKYRLERAEFFQDCGPMGWLLPAPASAISLAGIRFERNPGKIGRADAQRCVLFYPETKRPPPLSPAS